MKLVEAGGIRGERQPQCYYPYPLPHPHLQGSIRGSSLIHLSGELVRGREGGECSLQGPYKETLPCLLFPAGAL